MRPKDGDNTPLFKRFQDISHLRERRIYVPKREEKRRGSAWESPAVHVSKNGSYLISR